MKQTTKLVLGLAAASSLGLAAVNVALAYGGPGFGRGGGGHHGMMGGQMHHMSGTPGPMMGGEMVTSVTERLATLKSELEITPEQKTAWQTYAAAVQGQAGLMVAHRQSMHSGTLSTDQRQTFHQQGMDQMRKVSHAAEALYAVLTPEQKARAGGLIGGR